MGVLVNNLLAHDQSYAINILSEYLRKDWPGATSLNQRELKQYHLRAPIAGWRVPLIIEGNPTPIDLLLGADYPYELPVICLVGEKKSLLWPHVENDNGLCVYPSNTTFNPADPIGVASDLLTASTTLLTDLVKGNYSTDFADEFQSYWIQTVDFKQPRVLVLNELVSPSRYIVAWPGKSHTLLSDSADTGVQWLQHYHQDKFSEDEFQRALFLWSDSPLIPEQYPRSNADIVKLAKYCSATELLQDFINEESNAFYVVIGFLTKAGPTAAAMRVQRPPSVSVGSDVLSAV